MREKGYLSFNPLRYLHPVMSLVLPLIILMLGGIGLPGGAVYIEQDRLRSRGWASAVALAGPMANALLAVMLAIVFAIARPPGMTDAWQIFVFLVELEIAAVVLNLIPLPPFDGFHAIAPWVPEAASFVEEHAPNAGLWTMTATFFMAPTFLWNPIFAAADVLGLPSQVGPRGFLVLNNQPPAGLVGPVLVVLLIVGIMHTRQKGDAIRLAAEEEAARMPPTRVLWLEALVRFPIATQAVKAQAMWDLAGMYRLSGHAEEAARLYGMLLRLPLQPDSEAAAHRWLADALEQAGRIEEAQEHRRLSIDSLEKVLLRR